MDIWREKTQTKLLVLLKAQTLEILLTPNLAWKKQQLLSYLSLRLAWYSFAKRADKKIKIKRLTSQRPVLKNGIMAEAATTPFILVWVMEFWDSCSSSFLCIFMFENFLFMWGRNRLAYGRTRDTDRFIVFVTGIITKKTANFSDQKIRFPSVWWVMCFLQGSYFGRLGAPNSVE